MYVLGFQIVDICYCRKKCLQVCGGMNSVRLLKKSAAQETKQDTQDMKQDTQLIHEENPKIKLDHCNIK